MYPRKWRLRSQVRTISCHYYRTGIPIPNVQSQIKDPIKYREKKYSKTNRRILRVVHDHSRIGSLGWLFGRWIHSIGDRGRHCCRCRLFLVSIRNRLSRITLSSVLVRVHHVSLTLQGIQVRSFYSLIIQYVFDKSAWWSNKLQFLISS